MATYSYLLSGLLMGAFLLLLVAGVTRMQRPRTSNRGRAPVGTAASTPRRSFEDRVTDAARSQTTWIAAFVLLVLGFGGGTVLVVSETGVPSGVRRAAWLVMGGLFLGLMTAFVFWGVYDSGRSRGLPSSLAAAIGFWSLGLLLVVAVVIKLMLAS